MMRTLLWQSPGIVKVLKVSFTQWIQSNSIMLVNSGSLIGSTVVTSALGFAYWWLAARQFSLEAVGFASACVSSMLLLGSLCMLGMGTLLVTELPRQPGREVSLISSALLVVAAVGGIVGVLFALLAPYASAEFNPLRASVANTLVFAAGVSCTAVTLVFDQALIGVLRGGLQFWRNTFFAVAKLVLLFAIGIGLTQPTGITIYIAWAAGSAISLVALFAFIIARRGGLSKAFLPSWGVLRKLGPASIQHHFLNLTLQAPTLALPVLVTILLSASMNAWFYVSWMIVSFVFVVPNALTIVLHAMNSAQQAALQHKARVTIGIALATALLANCFLQFATKQILGLFGSSYATQAAWCLRALALAAFPMIIKSHYISICRIQDRIVQAMLAMLPGGVLEIAAAIVGAHLAGLSGLSLGWVSAITVEAIFMFRTVYKIIRPINSSLRVPVQENYQEIMPVWLMDTIMLAAVPASCAGTMHASARADNSNYHVGPLLRPVRLERHPASHMDMHRIIEQRSIGSRLADKIKRVMPSGVLDIQQIETLKMNSIRKTASRLPIQNGLKLLKPLDVALLLLPLLAFFLWATSLQHVSVQNINNLGLISVLSPKIIVALIMLTVGFSLTLQRPQLRVSLLALYLVLVIIMLYGVENIIEEAPRFSVVYRHAGYTEYIMRTGTVDPSLDAYFSWPGFFVLNAFVTRVAGYQTILAYAGWAPVFYNMIYFGPLYMIFTAITTNKRLIWLALWFFYLTNWIGQDYFSPQGLNLFLYLIIIAILLKWFKLPPAVRQRVRQPGPCVSSTIFSKGVRWFSDWLRAPDALRMPLQKWQRRGLLACLILIFGLTVFSHPLTPFFVLVSVTALVVFRRCGPFWLPILMAVMIGAWLFFMTRTFLAGHLSTVIGSFGSIGNNVSTSVTSRAVQGDPQHNFIASLRLFMTALIWGLAFLGGLRRLRKGHHDLTYILLAGAPFPLIVAQDYGGEMFLRVYLFALPFMVFFAASLFYIKHSLVIRKTFLWLTVAITITNLVLPGGFFFTRYGNENADYMTHAEMNGARYLYSVAPAGSLLIEGWFGTPWQFQDYEKYSCISLADALPDAVMKVNVSEVIKYIENQKSAHTYLIFTRGQKVQAYALSGVPNGALDRLENALLKSGKFKMIYSNPDAQVFLFLRSIQGGSP